MRKAVISTASVLLAVVFAFAGYLIYTGVKSYNYLYGTYKLEYLMWGPHKVECGTGSLTEDYIILVFRDDGSFTLSQQDAEEDATGTWTKREGNKYDLVFISDSELSDGEPIVRTAVFKGKKCRIFFDTGEEACCLKYFSKETD